MRCQALVPTPRVLFSLVTAVLNRPSAVCWGTETRGQEGRRVTGWAVYLAGVTTQQLPRPDATSCRASLRGPS